MLGSHRAPGAIRILGEMQQAIRQHETAGLGENGQQ